MDEYSRLFPDLGQYDQYAKIIPDLGQYDQYSKLLPKLGQYDRISKLLALFPNFRLEGIARGVCTRDIFLAEINFEQQTLHRHLSSTSRHAPC